MNFAILTESKYFETTYLNVQQIRRYHPDSEIIICDVGLSYDQRSKLHDYDCRIIQSEYTGDSEMEKMILKPIFVAALQMPSCYMDADTVLMKPMDVEPKGDIVVTVRESKYGKINSGVFIASSKKLLDDWSTHAESLAKKTNDRLSEQNAINNLYREGNYDFHEVPCDIYNYPKIERGIPDNVVVAHLKSGRYKDPKMIDILRCSI